MSTIDTTCVNAIRVLSADAIQKANSGHPGLPLGAAPIAYELWANHMNHNAKDPKWANRDRFILSAGHGSMLLYSLLHFYGYGLTMDDIKQFRQDGSLTPGHPNTATRRASKRRQAPSAPAWAWLSAWPWQKLTWQLFSINRVIPSSTTTPSPSAATAA